MGQKRHFERFAAEASDTLFRTGYLAEFCWAVAQLPERQRAVLVLRYWAALPVAEVADILGCSSRPPPAGSRRSCPSTGRRTAPPLTPSSNDLP